MNAKKREHREKTRKRMDCNRMRRGGDGNKGTRKKLKQTHMSWSSSKPQVRVALHNFSSSSNQRALSISLRTAHQPGHARRRCYWIGAVMSLYCTTVVPKSSRDSVSGAISFRTPAVELRVVTIHSWGQLRHTKNESHRRISRVIG